MSRRFPAEWEVHEATLFTWPWDGRIWGRAHADARSAIAGAIAAISQHENVVVHVPDDMRARECAAEVAELGGVMTRIEAVLIPSDDVWVRDHGPTFVLHDGARRAVDWNFNAWGGKFSYSRDARVAARVAARFHAPCERSDMIFEGGAIETDGKGTVMTTESVALTDTRNPGWTRERVEEELAARLGAERVVWLLEGMATDDTDGHIDTLARFSESGAVLVHTTVDPAHPDATVLERNRAELSALGWPVIPLPAPTLVDPRGDILPASYANFYVANGCVLMPTYASPHDETAARIIADAFPGRTIVPIDSIGLVSQGGAIHCATQQVPAASG